MQNARTEKEKKQYPETTILIECLDILTINKLLLKKSRKETNTKHKVRQTRDNIHTAIRHIYKTRSKYMLLLRRRRFLCTLGYPSSCMCVRAVQLVDLVNHLSVKPNEHHSLDLTCKHVAAQVINEVGER